MVCCASGLDVLNGLEPAVYQRVFEPGDFARSLRYWVTPGTWDTFIAEHDEARSELRSLRAELDVVRQRLARIEGQR
jgi:hypothetical protein